MRTISVRESAWLTSILVVLIGTGLPAAAVAPPPAPLYPEFPSETPAAFKPVTGSFDYERREAMIPMRDGVKLHTVILIPKGARNAPILLTRTPYDADDLTSHKKSSHLGFLRGPQAAQQVAHRSPRHSILLPIQNSASRSRQRTRRHSTSMFPIRQSRYRIVHAPFNPSATTLE
jgi:hypothetical protein